MKKFAKETLRADLYRYYGDQLDSLKTRLRLAFLPSPEIKFLILLRKTQGSSNKLLYYWRRFRLLRHSYKCHIQISTKTKIGRGFYIGHFGRVIINPAATIGENCNIATGVTIGQTNRGKRAGTPKIGDRVWIGANAMIVGGITIGDDVLIAPNAFVNFDVPSHSVVVGNPAVVHPRENATEGYINRVYPPQK